MNFKNVYAAIFAVVIGSMSLPLKAADAGAALYVAYEDALGGAGLANYNINSGLFRVVREAKDFVTRYHGIPQERVILRSAAGDELGDNAPIVRGQSYFAEKRGDN